MNTHPSATLTSCFLPTAVNADEFEDNWFNETELKIQLGETHSIDHTDIILMNNKF